MFELFKNKMKKINIKNCDMSIDLIRKYCSIISNATAIPFKANQHIKNLMTYKVYGITIFLLIKKL